MNNLNRNFILKVLLILLTLTSFLNLTSCGRSKTYGPETTSSQSPLIRGHRSPTLKVVPSHNQMQLKLQQLINQFRESHNLAPLKFSTELNQVALIHSEKMAKGHLPFGHDESQARFAKVDTIIPYRRIGEVVASNWNNPQPVEQALKSWQNSDGHRELLLTPWENQGTPYAGLGIAAPGDDFENQTEFYFTLIFVSAK
jgi:uncharacterized protein YkwD